MPSRPKLGVGVVGLGVGQQHALAFARDDRCEVRWLFDLDARRAASLAAALGQGAVASSYEEILADPRVDVVSIASYDDAHFGQLVPALAARKHAFVEKPLCRTEGELETVRRAWEGRGRPHLASNLVLRAAPLYRWLKGAIVRGDLGTLYAFDGDYLYGRVHKIIEGWRRDVSDYSVMEGGGIHLVDLMLWLTGERPARVSAVGNRIVTAGTGFRYKDYVAATFEFPSGLVGRVSANFGCVHPHQHVVRVFGTRGTFIYDDAGARLHTSRDPETPSTALPQSPLPETKGALVPDFVGAIVEGRDPGASAQREFDLVSVCVAADRALASGASAEVRYP